MGSEMCIRDRVGRPSQIIAKLTHNQIDLHRTLALMLLSGISFDRTEPGQKLRLVANNLRKYGGVQVEHLLIAANYWRSIADFPASDDQLLAKVKSFEAQKLLESLGMSQLGQPESVDSVLTALFRRGEISMKDLDYKEIAGTVFIAGGGDAVQSLSLIHI